MRRELTPAEIEAYAEIAKAARKLQAARSRADQRAKPQPRPLNFSSSNESTIKLEGVNHA